MLENATDLELGRFALAIIGVIANVFLLWFAQRAIRQLKKAGKNGPRKLVAKGVRRNEAIRVEGQLVFFIYYGFAVLNPPAVPGKEVSLQSIILTVVVAAVQVTWVWGAACDLIDRQKLIVEVDELEAAREAKQREAGTLNDY